MGMENRVRPHGYRRLVIGLMLLVIASGAAWLPATVSAQELGRFLEMIEPADIFPGVDRLGQPEGDPPVARAFRGGQHVGYVFLNADFVNSTGYSGKPIFILVAIDKEGVIAGAKLVEHTEPIVLIGIPEQRIAKVLDGYAGRSMVEVARGDDRKRKVDIVSGATVTVIVMDDSILRSSIRVARRYGLGGIAPAGGEERAVKRVLDVNQRTIADWAGLVGSESVGNLALSLGDVNQAFAETGNAVAAQRPELGDPEESFIDLYGALVSIPSVGLSLLGETEYRNLETRLKPGQHAILLAARGRYSFKGSGYVRGGIFDRFQIIQGDNSIRFRDRDHKRLRTIAAQGSPELTEVDVFRIPEGVAFDPALPWRIELLVSRATGPTSKAFLTFNLDLQTPEKFLQLMAQDVPASVQSEARSASQRAIGDSPVWQRLWREKAAQTSVLAVALGLLTILFFVQDWLVKRPRLTEGVRLGFLTFTVFGIGFYAKAQLSVVNITAFFNSLITDFRWEYFLLEPLIFILWLSVAASLLFWGRGAYCGWLCPFGALQELINKAAKLAKIPQLQVPWWIHERSWPIKYIIFLALFGVSFYSVGLAEQLAEVEPFKTAIILKFARAWPFVLFAVLVLVAGVFIERFYCRYLCPLGAALAIPGRMRMFEWLRRYKECGSPCQRCRNECMVQAIHPDGHINPNECLYCLHCQVVYHDDHKCPVVVQRRLKRERRAAVASKTMQIPGSAGSNQEGGNVLGQPE